MLSVTFSNGSINAKRQDASNRSRLMGTDALSPLLGRTLVVVPHPDDETISCGGLLQHMREPVVVFATDGAPEDDFFWRRFGSREAYAAVREQEARVALAAVGVNELE